MTFAQVKKYLVDLGITSEDFDLRDDGAGAYIERWGDALPSQPTAQDVVDTAAAEMWWQAYRSSQRADINNADRMLRAIVAGLVATINAHKTVEQTNITASELRTAIRDAYNA